MPNSLLLFAVAIAIIGCESTDRPPSAVRVLKSSGSSESAANFTASISVEQNRKGPPPAVEQKRMVIKTANLTLEVVSFDEALKQIQAIAERRKGFVLSSSAFTREETQKSGTMVVRVPTNQFTATVDEIKKLASRVEYEDVNGNDVREEFYDVSARLKNKEKAEERFREILLRAKSVKEILEIEQALTNVREEIERLTGRKRYLADRVDLSTIHINMHEPRPIIAAGPDAFWVKVMQGVRQGTAGFGNTLSFLISSFLAGLPAMLVFLLILGVGFRFYRRYKARSA